jgi:hypothetical protein
MDPCISPYDALWINVCRKIHTHSIEKKHKKFRYYVRIAAVHHAGCGRPFSHSQQRLKMFGTKGRSALHEIVAIHYSRGAEFNCHISVRTSAIVRNLF